MSDQEGFLSRWSRLKREGEPAASEPDSAAGDLTATTPPATADATVAAEPERAATAEPKEAAATAVDLAALPPLESITAGSDIRAFLAPGIPAQLTRAALRRAWVADPAIRDFVGLAENAWDFNAPDAVPGFGSLMPSPDAGQLIADATAQDDAPSGSLSRGERETLQKPGVSESEEKPAAAQAENEGQAVDQGGPQAGETANDAAAVQEQRADDRPASRAHRHGGALPR